jgi:hypothetical protein
MIKKIGQIYCDMDGVLVNFKDPVEKTIKDAISGNFYTRSALLNKKIGKLKEKFKIADEFSFQDHNLEKSARKFMMSLISVDPAKFFADLPPYQDGAVSLWKFLHTFDLKVNVLSAPVPDFNNSIEPAREGKTFWVKKHLNPQPEQIIIAEASKKYLWAVDEQGPPNVLIDDKSSTIDAWNQAGGIGILHVSKQSDETMKALVKRTIDFRKIM